MNNYIKVSIDRFDERLMAFLSLLPFESFEDVGEDGMIAYIEETKLDEEARQQMEKYISKFECTYTEEVVYPKNWNAEWEASFQPVEVEDFCRIRADFHSPGDGFKFDIIINPKMAFGTGHHETTYMMLQQMKSMDFKTKTVFDYGCGTGVLSIVASKLGADQVLAIDIEEESYLNTIENCEVNHVNNVKTLCGELNLVKDQSLDIILANINRQVLLDSVEGIYNLLQEGGQLLLSGILASDKEIVETPYIKKGFKMKEIIERGKWLCFRLEK